jgi:epoxyqueuosine reductase
MNPRELADFTRRAALALGFDACGITDLAPNAASPALARWLEQNYHGDMAYMARQIAVRREPARSWPLAKFVVVVLHNYYSQSSSYRGECSVARYAQGDDYHAVTLDKLRDLANTIRSAAGGGSFKYYVDAGPLPERELARRAGLGWVGKNTMLIHPGIGSFTFIGCLLTDLELAPDTPFDEDRCGTCRACLDACPTHAFPEPRVLDATRCISYLTIESHSDIPDTLRPLVGDNLFGCDICQDVCPWNVKFATPAREPRFAAPQPDARPTLKELPSIDDATFDAVFGHTAMERAGARGLRRNAVVVLENQAVSSS